MEDAVDALWHRYRSTGDATAREQLILHYAPLVKFIAGRMRATMARHLDPSDLVAYGLTGLLDAIDRFDPSLGAFRSYAAVRIRGAILDASRAEDWVPRTVRRQARELDTAARDLEARLHRTPTNEEIADELGVTVEQLNSTLEQVTAASIIALDEQSRNGDDGDGGSVVDTLVDLTEPTPDETYARTEERAELREHLLSLPGQEREVLALYYFESMTLREVGDVLGVSESRACQIHGKAVLSLRAKLGG